jgi:WD40 repeat protein
MDSTVTLWNPSLSLIRKLSLASSSATALVQVNNMVFIADAKQIFVFDAYTYDLIQTVDLPTIDYLSSSDCNSTNSALEEIHRAPTVMKLDRNQLGTVMGRPAAVSSTEPWIGYFVRCMAQVGDFVWVCTDGFVCFVDIATLTVVPNVHIPIPKINTLAYIKSTNQVWGGCSDCSIYVWDAASPSSTGKIQPLRHITGWSSDRVSKLVNWDDKYVYSGSWDKRLRVWDAQTATMLCESKKVHECPIMSIVVLPYRWLRIVPPKSNDSPPNTTPAEPRREAQSLPPKLPSAESLVLPRVNSTEAQMSNTGHQTNQEVEAETTTIMTVLTADWSSVSLWV